MRDFLADNALAAPIPPATPVDPVGFRDAMSLIASAVHVVTSDGPAGRGGVTISAMTSISDNPATILFCLNRASRFGAVLTENSVFCINTLAAGSDNIGLADAFAGRGDLGTDARFAIADWTSLATGAPVLSSARIALDCRITAIQDVATHAVVMGEVVGIRRGENSPGRSDHGDQKSALLYMERGYKAL